MVLNFNIFYSIFDIKYYFPDNIDVILNLCILNTESEDSGEE